MGAQDGQLHIFLFAQSQDKLTKHADARAIEKRQLSKIKGDDGRIAVDYVSQQLIDRCIFLRPTQGQLTLKRHGVGIVVNNVVFAFDFLVRHVGGF